MIAHAPRPSLPRLYLVTPEPGNRLPEFMRQLEASLLDGIRLVQFRAKTIEPALYRKLAADVLACCRQHDAVLLLNADPQLLDDVDADGVHLDQLRQAEAIAADFVTLSPVLATASHPGAQTLGWSGFAELAAQTTLPVYALGGMNAGLLMEAQKNGAYGVAGIQAFWGR
jgi:8-oxo-dGTP diphosphatase